MANLDTDEDLLRALSIPEIDNIVGRRSTIDGTFAKAVMPERRILLDEIRRSLEILELSANELRCAYCGDLASEWDHFRAVTEAKLPTGYGTSAKNLLPSCGKCNQSRGNKPWRKWMESDAPKSPKTRRPDGLAERARRLEAWEQWSHHDPVNLSEVVGPDLLAEYRSCRDNIIMEFERAQVLADRIRERVQRHVGEEPRPNRELRTKPGKVRK